MTLVVARFSTNSTLDPRRDPQSWLGRLTWQADSPADLTEPAIAGDWKKFVKRWRTRLPDPAALPESARFGASRLSLSSDAGLISNLLQHDRSASPAIVEWASSWLDAVQASPSRMRSRKSRQKTRTTNCPWIGAIEAPASSRNGSKRDGDLNGDDAEGRVAASVTRPSAALPQSELELSLLCDVLLLCSSSLTASQCWDVWSAVVQGLLSWSEFLDEGTSDALASAASAPATGELFWKFGLLFEGLDAAERLREVGRKRLQEMLHRVADENGRPNAVSLCTLAADLGVFSRTVAWGDLFAQPLFDESDRSRWERWIVSAAALMTIEGRLLTDQREQGQSEASPEIDSLIQRIDFSASLSGLPTDSRVRLSLASLAAASGTNNGMGASSLPRKLRERLTSAKKESSRPSFQSESGAFALLRTDWRPEASSIAVSYDSPIPLLSLALEGTPLFQGPWEISVSVDGQELPLAGAWDSVCWFTDEDVDYLELQQKLPSGVHLERQIVLSRRGRFLILADCVSRGAGALEYRSRLPFAAEASATADVDTRECRVALHGTTARVIPAALACERLHSTTGTLEAVDGGLELRQSGSGGLLAPLLIDWHPERREDQADWKSLAVTEGGLKLPAESASGHRVRIGRRHQILIYRAVRRGEGLRAVMGYHTGNETVVARLKKNGEYEPVLLVE